ncbi:MAG: hypothetical protein ABI886_17705, partial [Betaproteobacteria bacterium]
MSDEPSSVAARRASDAHTRRRLLLIAAIAVAPVLLSYLAYYAFPREARVNYGVLLPTVPMPSLTGSGLAGEPFSSESLRGRWVMLWTGSGRCGAACTDALYASRQARTIQNAERERIVRVWAVADDAAPSPVLLADHPDLTVARVPAASIATLPDGADRIYL